MFYSVLSLKTACLLIVPLAAHPLTLSLMDDVISVAGTANYCLLSCPVCFLTLLIISQKCAIFLVSKMLIDEPEKPGVGGHFLRALLAHVALLMWRLL